MKNVLKMPDSKVMKSAISLMRFSTAVNAQCFLKPSDVQHSFLMKINAFSVNLYLQPLLKFLINKSLLAKHLKELEMHHHTQIDPHCLKLRRKLLLPSFFWGSQVVRTITDFFLIVWLRKSLMTPLDSIVNIDFLTSCTLMHGANA